MRLTFRQSGETGPAAAHRAPQARDGQRNPYDDGSAGPSYLPGRRRNPGWLLLLGMVVLIVVVFGYRAAQNRPPQLAASCTKTALALSATSGVQDRPVAWSATGPKGRYVLTVDAPAVTARGAAPAGGPGTRIGQPFSMTGCAASGQFSLAVSKGSHTVRMFRLASGGATAVANKKVTVQ